MSDSLNTPTLPKTRSISAICKDWRISNSRCNLECTEASTDDEVAAATDRDEARTEALLKEINCARPISYREINDAIYLPIKLLNDGADSEQVVNILQRATDWMDALSRRSKHSSAQVQP